MPSVCEICDGEMDKLCVRCYGAKCRICKEPLYRNEDVCFDTLGKRHCRCKRVACPRPVRMPEVVTIGVEAE